MQQTMRDVIDTISEFHQVSMDGTSGLHKGMDFIISYITKGTQMHIWINEQFRSPDGQNVLVDAEVRNLSDYYTCPQFHPGWNNREWGEFKPQKTQVKETKKYGCWDD